MAYCSHIQIVHGATVLLDFGEMIEAPPTVNGQQIVEVTPLVRASHPSITPRGNEQHTVEFVKSPKVASAFDSVRSALEHSSTFHRTAGVVTITVDDGGTDYYELQDAVVEAWSATHGNAREALSVRIVGGVLKRVPVLEPDDGWESQASVWEEA